MSGNLSRTSFCDKLGQIVNQSLPVADGLRGKHLTVGSYVWFPFLQVDDAGNYVGWEVDLLTELSRRAGFTFSISEMAFAWNESWSEQLLTLVMNVDLVTFGYWAITSERLVHRVDSPYAFVDLSAVFVSTEASTEEPSLWSSFMRCFYPFGLDVWITLLLLWLFTGLLYFFLNTTATTKSWEITSVLRASLLVWAQWYGTKHTEKKYLFMHDCGRIHDKTDEFTGATRNEGLHRNDTFGIVFCGLVPGLRGTSGNRRIAMQLSRDLC